MSRIAMLQFSMDENTRSTTERSELHIRISISTFKIQYKVSLDRSLDSIDGDGDNVEN
jgi:hypothetical protein